MTVKEKASCILTIEMLKRLALNIHGLIDVVDDNNIKKVIKLIQDYPEWIDITENSHQKEKRFWSVILMVIYT